MGKPSSDHDREGSAPRHRPLAAEAEAGRSYALLDSLLEGCQIIDRQWRYVYLNEAALLHARRTSEELLGLTIMEMFPGIEQTELFAVLQRCMTERTHANLENEFVYPNGVTGWFDFRIQPVPEGLFVLSLDISARKRAERGMQQRIERLRSLRSIDLAILGTTDLRLALRTVLDETRTRLEVDAAAVFLFDSPTLRLEIAACQGFREPPPASLRLRLGVGPTGRAALERSTIVLRELSGAAGDQLVPLLRREGFEAYCAAPLVAKGQLVGVLAVAHRSALAEDSDWQEFLEALADQTAIAIYSGRSFEESQRARVELELAYETTIEGWSRALDLRDKETEGHTQRVTEMTLDLARLAGMTGEELVHVRYGALLHDIGKMGIPDAILLKPDKLTEEEWEVMRRHPTYAYELLAPIEYLRPALDIPHCHHEWWDGNGYPRGLRGEQIPLAARLFAVADVWDALRSDRPYRSAWPEEKVLEHIRGLAGTHLDPRAVELFLALRREGARED